MTEFDYGVLAVLACSALLGAWRGLLKEFFSLLAYASAAYGAMVWGPRAFPWFKHLFGHDMVGMLAAYIVVFLAVLLMVGLISKTIRSMISYVGLGPADRGLGFLFGLARGLIMVVVVVILLGYTDFPSEPWWVNAKFSHTIIHVIGQIKHLLPVDIAQYLPY